MAIEQLLNEPDGPRHGDRPAVTYLDLQHRLVSAGYGRRVVRTTFERLIRDGCLVAVADVKMKHCKRPLKAYAPPQEATCDAGMALQELLVGWSRS